jgi:hypothetical protein
MQRLEMYRSLKDQTVEKFGEGHYQEWDDTYGFFVGLFAAEKLGAGRLVVQYDSTENIQPAHMSYLNNDQGKYLPHFLL